MEDMLPLTILPVATAAWAANRVTDQVEGAAAIGSDYSGLASDSDSDKQLNKK